MDKTILITGATSGFYKAKAEQVYQGTIPLTGSDIADIVYWVTIVPPRVNINSVKVMPVCQSRVPFAIHSTTASD